jgi:hypothetical protein
LLLYRPLAGAALVLALTACQNPAPPPPAASAPEPPVAAAVRAREAAARSDWTAAAPLFRQAIAEAPGDLALHYGLAVAATYLENREEATREFRWVLANAAPESEEYRLARTWLADSATTATPAGTSGTPPAPLNIPHVERTGDAGLYGRVTWSAEPNGPPSTRRMQVHLYGIANSATKEQRYTVRTDDEGRFEFKRIVAGPYKLTNRVAGKPTWRVRVEVEPGRDTAFDLYPGNSTNVRDDFPEESR